MLTLKRTYESPPVGPWSDYDYDVFDGDQRVGRIILAQQTPEGQPWLWMTARVPQSMDDHGYAASCEHAMADFEARWDALHPLHDGAGAELLKPTYNYNSQTRPVSARLYHSHAMNDVPTPIENVAA